MGTKEQIILATLELASENGLGSVSMSQIAEKVGIKKPSLYNHFSSKEEIITAMYRYLRQQAKDSLALADIDYGEFVRDRSAQQALSAAVTNYGRIVSDERMLAFYKVIYSQRAVDASAAGILAEETEKMIKATKNLFYALSAHGKLTVSDIDTAAVSFAMTVHSIMDYQLDCAFSGRTAPGDMLQDYIKWFSKQYGGRSS